MLTNSEIYVTCKIVKTVETEGTIITENSGKKDGRFHLAIKDVELRRRIKQAQEREHLSQEEVVKKYLKMPEEPYEVAEAYYREFTEQALMMFRSQETKERMTRILGLYWANVMAIWSGHIDVEKYEERLNQDIKDDSLRTVKGKIFQERLK